MVEFSIIMPVYNEEETLKEMVERVIKVFSNTSFELIIINDGSSDKSEEIIKEIASKDKRIKFITYKPNKGKGYAIRQGIKHAEGKVIGIQDADMEYDPKELKALMKIVLNNKADVVYGSRFLGNIENISLVGKIGNIILSLLTTLLYGQTITDMETCYKVGKAEVFKSLNLESDRFEIEPEITAKLILKGYQILEVPISYKAREIHKKKLRPFKDGIKALKTLIKYRF